MLELQLPWVLALLPAPLLVWWLLPPYRDRQPSVRIPRFSEAAEAAGREPTRGAVVMRRSWLQWFLAVPAWALLVLALARPVYVEPPIEKIESARDLLLAVDLSGSMETRDMRDPDGRPLDRLSAVKTVLDDFIARRSGDRIGLIFFGTAPFLQASFTLDHELVRELLAEARVAMAGPQTMLGDAIGLAIKTFENSEAEQKVLVVLTDGNDTGSRVPPATAAEIAASEDLTVHTIGFGDPASSGEGLFDAQALEEIASATGGVSFMADDRAALEAAYRQLDEIEPLNFDTLSYRPVRTLFQWPLGAALALLLVYYALMAVWLPIRRRAASHA